MSTAKPVKNIFISVFYISLVIVFLMIFPEHNVESPKNLPTSMRAYILIKNQTGDTFLRQNTKRLELLNSDEKNIVFEKYIFEPDLVYYNDMGANPDDWFNMIVADYFDKDSVIVKQPLEVD
jgi:hypothetical protein